MTIKVNLLRFDPADMSAEERKLFEHAFDTTDIEYQRTDPTNYLEHSDQCNELQPDVVLLPKDRPIPDKAMEEGFDHVAVINGELMRLVAIHPVFEPYRPAIDRGSSGGPMCEDND